MLMFRGKFKLKRVLFVLVLFCLFSCESTDINGIKIESDLYTSLTTKKLQELEVLIESVLNKDEKALVELINFNCGGGAGCYDLGYVFTQIIYQLGEAKFVQLVHHLKPSEALRMLSLIGVGLEYGADSKFSKMNSDKIQVEFPELFLYLEYKKIQ